MIEKIVTGSFFTNSYIISNDNMECVLVDPGLMYGKAAALIKQKYVVKAILITHGHVDHIDGIKYFKDVPIYIHKNDYMCLYDPYMSLYEMMGMDIPFDVNDLNVIKVSGGDKFNLIGYDFSVLHTPGHTQGSVCYNYLDNVLSGDTLFYRSMGRTDFPGGDESDMMKSLKKIMNAYPDNYYVYPGHDNTTTIKDEREGNPYIF